MSLTTLIRVPAVYKATAPGRRDAGDIDLPGITLAITVRAHARVARAVTAPLAIFGCAARRTTNGFSAMLDISSQRVDLRMQLGEEEA
ncbi:uncharacterized protein N7479_006087 [Penicillium vulpinum]|uniref:uncharacterized protein n=1 Tax=Penicillium vulpinum TaxID=29845 RepID=UPI002547E880|nr:uncharacterized protein N7479_006087 [Penicillium vulpinum]KAJ5958937.1 hypothetical protein N7479_006087 [Penicillium vulpinum]